MSRSISIGPWQDLPEEISVNPHLRVEHPHYGVAWVVSTRAAEALADLSENVIQGQISFDGETDAPDLTAEPLHALTLNGVYVGWAEDRWLRAPFHRLHGIRQARIDVAVEDDEVPHSHLR
jgi:hypothetical protein